MLHVETPYARHYLFDLDFNNFNAEYRKNLKRRSIISQSASASCDLQCQCGLLMMRSAGCLVRERICSLRVSLTDYLQQQEGGKNISH